MDEAGLSGRPRHGATAAWWVLGAAFLFRFLTVDFPNDHFVHLARAWQILEGELPVRDFFDEGRFLTYYASVAALASTGRTLLGEAVLTAGGIALGTALTYALARRTSGSALVALAASTTAFVTLPRLYNYPKVFLYGLAVAAVMRYARAPGTASVNVLALLTAIAFLFRHDHGLFIGLFVVAFLLVLHWRQWTAARRALVMYGAMTAILVAPWALFVQSSVGLWTYFQGSAPQATDASTARLLRLPLHVDLSAPWLVVEPPRRPRINVRWAEGADEAAIRQRETAYGLTQRVQDEGRTSSYVLDNDSSENIRSLIRDPLVEDTHGLDRERNRPSISETPGQRLRRLVPLLRTQVAPGVFTEENALAWLYYAALLLPVLALAIVIGARAGIDRPTLALHLALILLSVVLFQGMVRGQPRVRLPDVAAPLAVLGAAATGLALRGRSDRRRRGWRTREAVAALLWLVTLWSAGSVGQFGRQLAISGLTAGPVETWARLGYVASQLRRPPFEAWAGDRDTGLAGMVRYVRACTAPSDRLFVAWFEPELYFYSERRFAGGQVVLDPGYPIPPAEQQLTVERFSRQRVPIVLADETWTLPWLVDRFPLIASYLHERYRVSAQTTFDSPKVYYVLLDRDTVPTGVYARFDLPCLR